MESYPKIQIVAFKDEEMNHLDTAAFSSFDKCIAWADIRVLKAKFFRCTADDWNFFLEGRIVNSKINWKKHGIE